VDEIALLQQIPLFADLSKETLASLAGTLEQRTYRKGQTILRQGEAGESLFVIVSGQVRIYTLSPDGHELSMCIYSKGDFFGEMALLTGQPRSASAEAMRRTETLVLHRLAFHNHLLSHPQAAVRLIETLSQRLRRTTESVEELVSLNVNQRIARKLLELAERYGVEQAGGRILIDLDLSQEAIASLVGTTRESANRALSALRDQGIVQIERVHILVNQPGELEKLLAC
jgi:CRP/FNR family cyclic AMP-dependent transcriptional regulator